MQALKPSSIQLPHDHAEETLTFNTVWSIIPIFERKLIYIITKFLYPNRRNCNFSFQRSLALTALAIFSLTTIFSKLAPVYAQQITSIPWQFIAGPKDRIMQSAVNTLVSSVSARTKGKFRISIIHDQTESLSENIDALKYGAYEIGTVCPAFEPTKTPILSVMGLPMLSMSDPKAQGRVYENLFNFSEFRKGMDRWNIQVLFSELLPPKEILGYGTPPKKITDLRGMKIGGVGFKMETFLRSMGATHFPTNQYPDTLVTAPQGSLDATVGMSPLYGPAHTGKFRRAFSWYTDGMNVGSAACVVAYNQKAHDRLPRDYQQALREVVPKIYKEMIEKISKDLAAVKGIQKVGVTPDELARIRMNFASPVWNEWSKQANNMGIKGQKIIDLVVESGNTKNK